MLQNIILIMLKNTTSYLCFLLLVLSFQNGYTQNVAIKWYNTEDGLPQNTIQDIVKDRYGFLWLSTENGLMRYDGHSFLNLTINQINNRSFLRFYGSSKRDSIYIFNQYTPKPIFINKRQANISDTIDYIKHQVRNNENFVELANSYYLDQVNFDNNHILKSQVGTYFLNKDSIFFESKFDKYSANLDTKSLNRKDAKIVVIDGNILVISKMDKSCKRFTQSGLVSTDIEQLLYSEGGKFIWQTVNNQSFFLYKDTLYNLQIINNKVSTKLLAVIENFDALDIQSIYYDSIYNKIYFGSLSKGFGILSFQHFQVSKTDSNASDAVYYSHLPYANQTVITPDGQILNSNELVKDFNFKELKSYIHKLSIIDDRKGGLWVQNNGKLQRLRVQNTTRPALKNTVNYNLHFTFLFDLDTEIAAAYNNGTAPKKNGTTKEGLIFFSDFDLQKVKEHYNFNNSVKAVCKENESIVLVGCGQGLFRLNRKTKEKQLIKGTDRIGVRNIQKTSDGQIWIMTSGQGLFLLKNNVLVLMPMGPKDALKNVHCILEDKLGNLWISTNNGLFKIPESELLQYADNPQKNIRFYSYSKNDGLLTNEFNGGCNPCGNKLANGQFTFPSMNGIVFFDPLKVPAYYPKDELYVERYKTDGEGIKYFTDVINLENNFFRATIYPDVPYFSDYRNLYVEAFLEGKSSTWERVDLKDGYNLTQLSHGSYEVKFRVLTSPNADFTYKTVTIKVKPLFHQSFYFRVLMLAILAICFLLIHKIRILCLVILNKKLELMVNQKTNFLTQSLAKIEEVKYNLKKETKQQKKLLGTITHDIATPLKYITIVAKNLSKLSDEELTKNRNLIVSLQHSSEELYIFTNALKDYANLYNQNMEKPFETADLFICIEEKISLFYEVAGSKSIAFINKVPENTPIYTNLSVFKMALHNIIDNAVKYTEIGSISFNYEIAANSFCLHIADTGIGIDENLIEYYEDIQDSEDPDKLTLQKFGIGLHMVIQLLPIINGKLHFKKNTPKGTIVTLEILI